MPLHIHALWRLHLTGWANHAARRHAARHDRDWGAHTWTLH